MAVIYTLISLVVCTSNAYASKCNDDNGRAYIDMTVVCTSNAYGSKWNNDTGHSCIDMSVACTSNA